MDLQTLASATANVIAIVFLLRGARAMKQARIQLEHLQQREARWREMLAAAGVVIHVMETPAGIEYRAVQKGVPRSPAPPTWH